MKRLYYTDSHLTTFEGRVVETGELDGRPFAVLDRTAFYPTTGGQPHDVGALGGRVVIDVVDRESDGAVLHVLDGSLDRDAEVAGTVDWNRRFDHMQQHTGQHVLSAAFVRAANAATVSFHLGSELSTIDLAGVPSAELIAAAEDLANQVVWEDRPVGIRFVSAGEAAALPLRKEPVRGGTLRLIEVPDFDLSACGGTHVTSTGAIGIIAVQSWERYKGGMRVSFACGGRALRQYRSARDVVSAAVRQLSIQPSELHESVSRLQAESRGLRTQVRELTERLAVFEAAALADQAESFGARRVVLRVIADRDGAALKGLAHSIVSREGHVAVLVSAARPALVVVARSADQAADAGAIVKALVARFGGKGGGRPDGAQGGGLDAEPDAIIAAVRELLS